MHRLGVAVVSVSGLRGGAAGGKGESEYEDLESLHRMNSY
jgi:hypothetical protein